MFFGLPQARVQRTRREVTPLRRVLDQLDGRGLTISKLADELKLDPTVVMGALEQLEQDGYLDTWLVRQDGCSELQRVWGRRREIRDRSPNDEPPPAA